ncbi:hypothetical protein J2D73_01370 [Acetobacter sacchari]|uniref:Secreted protein n=1 Tax=Acetobacter sacchari TaxID=2661687 RepID=A0ABS3LRC0_9PROT|nr:hypothetical protein [Acetobacter sacchari]MBO1358449.1 hypothetical protein [Acetobacter sacchari]
MIRHILGLTARTTNVPGESGAVTRRMGPQTFAVLLALSASTVLSSTNALAAPDDAMQTSDSSLTQAPARSAAKHVRTRGAQHSRSAQTTADAATSDHPMPQSLESQEQAPPPPDGYVPVQDMDVVLEAHSPQITAHRGPGLAPVDAQQTPRDDRSSTPLATMGGYTLHVTAPVVPPYNGAFTYTTYGGQPGNGRNAPGAWGAAGEP